MNPERWSLIQTLFEAALEKEPSYRITFLKEACKDDVDLYREVSSLLAADQQLNSLLDGQALDAVTYAGFEPDQDDVDLSQIGPYRVVKELGRGGMGLVLLAERADGQFDQRVALKVIKRGMDSDMIVRRFVRERQILARLKHPNIAHLLDGGVAPDGRPFFAMEHVEGTPLTHYCNKHATTIEQRLRLFVKVCDAVQYAHRNLVVHRDLKPGNILVTQTGDVKLLDFGIARLLNDDRDQNEPTQFTEAGMRVLTPEYAAPEQVRGEVITTQADIYALGVVLYELLTGLRPLKVGSHTPAVVEAVVCHEVPKRASSKILENTDLETTHGQLASRVARKLRGDLDTICARALHKEPERRFASAAEMRADVLRYLHGLPIQARSDAVSYRLRKFVGRHKAGVAVSMSFIALLAAVIVLYTLRLSDERDRARLEAAKAEQTTAFLASLFEASDPVVAEGDTLNARQILDLGSERIQEELADQPEVQVKLLTVIGDAYQSLALFPRSEEHYQSAFDHMVSLDDTLTAEAATLLLNLADIRHSLSDFKAALAFEERALAIQTHVYGEEHPDIAQTLLKMGSVNRSLGNYEEAFPLYRRAVAINEQTLPKDDPELGWSINNLGWALHSRGYYEEAEESYLKAVALQREYLGNDHPDLAFTLNNLGGLLWTTGRIEEGEPLVRESLTIRENLYGGDHPATMMSVNNLAGLLFRKGDWEGAEPLYRKTVEVNRKRLGENHRYVASGLGSLGNVHLKKGELEQAEALHKQSLAIRLTLFGHEHRQVASSKTSLATVYREQGAFTDAERYYNEAITFWRSLETRPIEAAYPLQGLGLTFIRADRHEEAETLLRDALDIRAEHLDTGDPLLAETRSVLGRCLVLQGKREEGEKLLNEALLVLEHTEIPVVFDVNEIKGWLSS